MYIVIFYFFIFLFFLSLSVYRYVYSYFRFFFFFFFFLSRSRPLGYVCRPRFGLLFVWHPEVYTVIIIIIMGSKDAIPRLRNYPAERPV